MRPAVQILIWCAATLVAAGCSDSVGTGTPAACSDSTGTAAALAVGSIVINPNHVALRQNAKLQITATPLDSLGNRMAGVCMRWRSDDATIAFVDATGMVTGRGAGSTRVWASAGSATQSLAVDVVASSVALAIGDSVAFEMPFGLAPSVVISLHSRDTIDLGFWATRSGPRLVPDTQASQGRVLSQSGGSVETAAYAAIQGRLIAPVSGTYVFRPSVDPPWRPCPPQTADCAWSAHGVVRARRSAPIVANTRAYAFARRVAQGDAATDTVVLQNVSAGSVSLGVSAPAWASTSPAGATLAAYPASQRFVVSWSTSNLGIDTGSIVFSGLPANVWNTTSNSVFLWLRVHERDVTLNTADSLVAIAASPNGELIGAANVSGKLYRIDPQTGQLSTLSSALNAGAQFDTRVVYGADSVLYVAQAAITGPLIISAVASDGTLSTRATLAFPGAIPFGVSATHVLYMLTGSGLLWRDLTSGAVDSAIVADRHNAELVVDPADGCVYYTTTGSAPPIPPPVDLHRWCPSTRSDTWVASVIGHVMAVDWTGLLYFTDVETGAIRVYDTSGRLLDTRWPAVTPLWYAVDSSGIFILDHTTIRRLASRSY